MMVWKARVIKLTYLFCSGQARGLNRFSPGGSNLRLGRPAWPPGIELLVSPIMERTLRVLLVEDAPFLRYAFSRLLRMQGYEVMEANDGQDALDRLATYMPDLILTDLMMPVMGGIELITQVRTEARFAHVPIVAITADATEQAEQAARRAGAIDVITKPIDLPALFDRLRFLIPDAAPAEPGATPAQPDSSPSIPSLRSALVPPPLSSDMCSVSTSSNASLV